MILNLILIGHTNHPLYKMLKLLFVFYIIIAALTFADGQTGKVFPLTFTDVAKQAGIAETTVYGGVASKKFIIETNGCGVAFFDYDNDNWTDI